MGFQKKDKQLDKNLPANAYYKKKKTAKKQHVPFQHSGKKKPARRV
jgi:hypothetical protein